MAIKQFLINLGIFNIFDLLEISAISLLFFIFYKSVINAEDNKVAFYFNIYSAFLCISYFVGFYAVNQILIIYLPAIFCISIILNKEVIQKSFIVVKNSYENNILEDNQWFEEFCKILISVLNTTKETVFVIEREDRIDKFINTKFKISSYLSKDLFDTVFDKHQQGVTSFIWLNSVGRLIAINAKWLENYQDAIFMTTNTDVVIIRVLPFNHTFDLYAKGNIHKGIMAQKLISILANNIFIQPKIKHAGYDEKTIL